MGQVLSQLGQQGGGQYGGGYGGRQYGGGGYGGGRRPVQYGQGGYGSGSPNYIGAPKQHPGASDPLGNPIDPTGGVNGPNGDWPGYYLGGGGALPKPTNTGGKMGSGEGGSGGGGYTGPEPGEHFAGWGMPNPVYVKDPNAPGTGVSAPAPKNPGTTVTNEGDPTQTNEATQNPMRRRGRMFDGMY